MRKRLSVALGLNFAILFTLGGTVFSPSSSAQVPPTSAGQSASAAAPSERGGDVLGRIADPAGLPIPNISVATRDVLSGETRTAVTTADGSFQFHDLAVGFYDLSASANGLGLQPRRIQVSTGHALDLGTVSLSLTGNQQQVVVSGSRVAELQDESPTEVLFVSKQQIQNTGFENVGAVLSELPGVTTRAQSYGVGLVGGEQIDGIDTKETLILLDGLPFVGARGIDEGIIDLNQQSVGPIDHIEVVKGAASALYGTDAIGGVINMISRSPSAPLNIDATNSGGSLGGIDTRLGAGWEWKKLSGYLDLEHHQMDGYSLLPDDPTTVGAYQNRQDFLFKLRYAFNPRAAIGFTSTAYANHDHGFGFTDVADPTDPNNFINTPTDLLSNDSTQTYAVVGDFVPTQTTTLQARFYTSKYNENSNSRLYEGDTPGSEFDQGNLAETYRRADTTVGQQWGSRQFIQAGYEYVHDEYRGDNRIVGGSAGQSVTTNDLWAQDRIQPFRNLMLTLGVRYQNNSSYGGHTVPKAGIVYRLNDHITLRSAFGLGFRAPNLGELYYHLLHLEYGYQVIGNPTLTPETSQSYSFGGTFDSRRFHASVNFFRNNLRNLIDNVLVCDETIGQDCSGQALVDIMTQYGIPESFGYDTSGAALFTFVNLNVDRAFTEGFDVNARYQVTPYFHVYSAYTYLEAVDTVTNTWLSNRNRHQGHVTFEYSKPRWGLVTNVRADFFSKWPNGNDTGVVNTDYAYGYQVWNFYASKSIAHGVRAFGSIDNFADSRDEKLAQNPASFDRPDYGRMFRIGLNYTFPNRE